MKLQAIFVRAICGSAIFWLHKWYYMSFVSQYPFISGNRVKIRNYLKKLNPMSTIHSPAKWYHFTKITTNIISEYIIFKMYWSPTHHTQTRRNERNNTKPRKRGNDDFPQGESCRRFRLSLNELTHTHTHTYVHSRLLANYLASHLLHFSSHSRFKLALSASLLYTILVS